MNDLQKIEFEILKESEEADGTFVPSNGNIKFGLYTAQDFVNHLGEVVITPRLNSLSNLSTFSCASACTALLCCCRVTVI